ncbi:MAG TPA: DsbA family protein [Anaerolinea thermolimosa]|uniref:DsbA family protein n=1 Tax=Anaerolinea thermolimosa TaxID=229919 RepID=A0A3D1JFM0_9CHLR|nr:thioredoxin domain-containing protein [Anaerolinea thermolimosa]GAP08281.1 protein-disulfide isomerase [Anaerolinea thermolimosa]HCE17312.1 DsbA family protein [Anaerolinea thermolimosa]
MDTELPESSLPAGVPSETTAKPRRSLRWLYWLPLAFGLGMVLSYVLFSLPLRKQVNSLRIQLASAQAALEEQGAAPQQVKRYDVPLDNDPIYGPANAPITIIEFSDYECPFCRKWHNEVWPRIKTEYGDKVRLVYRDFPLYGLHANAESAALAANCAGEQGKYWEYNDALFATTERFSRDTYELLAAQLSLDVASFKTCMDEERYQNEIQADYQYAAELGISSTPTFFINGLALVGAQPYEVFKQVIDMELNGEIPK